MSPKVSGTYYLLRRPDVVARIEGWVETRLNTGVPTMWSRPGVGRRAAAAALLADALGSPPQPALVHGFACDVLDYYATASELLLSLDEVRAWSHERGPELARIGAPSFSSLAQALAHRDSELSLGPRPGWLAVYRTIHGEPRLPETGWGAR